MTEAAILGEAATARATLSLSAAGTIKAADDKAAVARWIATIKASSTSSRYCRKQPAGTPDQRAHAGCSTSPTAPLTVVSRPLRLMPMCSPATPMRWRLNRSKRAGDPEAVILAWLAQISESD